MEIKGSCNPIVGGMVIGTIFTALIATIVVLIWFRPAIPTTNELDVAIVKAVFAETKDFCAKINAKRFKGQASGLHITAGCSK